jgi:hypothetical protein
MRTSELSGAALDWAVAKCEPDDKLVIYFDETTGESLCHDDWPDNQEFKPSTDWAQGGPIIERERIAVWFSKGDWKSQLRDTSAKMHGPTPLIAAMRCYVASKLGDEVQIPEGL